MKLIALTGLLLLTCPGNSWGQEAGKPSVFQQLFPKATGDNGYEELLLAAELTRTSEKLNRLQENGGTLSDKRAALADPPVARALALLRKGLSKPIRSPRAGKQLDENTVMPDLALMRNLARTMVIEQYVLLADGHLGEAIDSMERCLKLGYVIQSDCLIEGLVGIAVDAIALTTLSRHMDQLSARDCDRLVALVNQWLELPDPAIGVMMAERDVSMTMLNRCRDPKTFLDMIKISGGKDSPPSPLTTFVKDNPSGIGPTVDKAISLASAHYDLVLADLRKAPWERTPIPPIEDNSPGAQLYNLIFPTTNQVIVKYSYDMAQVQLLGVHAAIRRYRWEHDSLPNSLEDLRLGRMGIDPFTGKPLQFRRTGDTTYDLYSAGSPDANGVPSPIYLPRRT